MKLSLLTLCMTNIFLSFCSDGSQLSKQEKTETTTPQTKNKGDNTDEVDPGSFISHIAEPSKIRMFWKSNGQLIKTLEKLKEVEPQLVFAMNGGMFTEDYAPVGLYVEDRKQLKSIKKVNNPKVNLVFSRKVCF